METKKQFDRKGERKWRSPCGGLISFGLVSVPIRLLSAARAPDVQFHEIHRECGSRVHQQLYCPHDKHLLSRDEVTMGYHIEKDQYVLVEPEELKKLQPGLSKSMHQRERTVVIRPHHDGLTPVPFPFLNTWPVRIEISRTKIPVNHAVRYGPESA